MAEIEITRGDTLSYDCVWRDAAGVPLDLTGNTLTATVKLGAFSAALTVTILNAALGQFRLTALPSSTQTWPVARIPFDVKRTWGPSTARHTRTGYVKVSQEVTP